MPKYILSACLLAVALALAPGAHAGARPVRTPRSIWPLVSEEPSAEEILARDGARLLERAGFERGLDLSSHPLWKVHKYEGIDLKPVHLETELVRESNLPEARSESDQEPDLSFLDDLGGLAPYLPEPPAEEDESAALDLVAGAIAAEEESHPGFFRRLWWKIAEAPRAAAEGLVAAVGPVKSLLGLGLGAAAEPEEQLKVYLPATQGEYVAVVVPSSALGGSKPGPRPGPGPADEVELYARAQAEARSRAQGPVAGAGRADSQQRSQAWINSWTPHAAYSVHVEEGTRAVPREPVALTKLAESRLEPRPQPTAQRKSAEEPPKAQEDLEGQAVQSGQAAQENKEALEVKGAQEAKEAQKAKEAEEAKEAQEAKEAHEAKEAQEAKQARGPDSPEDVMERARQMLSSFHLPEGLIKRLQVRQQDVDAILNDKESAAKAAERLRALQREFEMRKEQLSYIYPSVRRQAHE